MYALIVCVLFIKKKRYKLYGISNAMGVEKTHTHTNNNRRSEDKITTGQLSAAQKTTLLLLFY